MGHPDRQSGQAGDAPLPPLRLVAAAITADERIALTLGPPARWERIPSYTLVPLEFPAAAPPAGVSDADAIRQAASRLGRQVEIMPSPWTHGPSPSHAIDRHRWQGAEPAPLLELTRRLPVEHAESTELRLVVVRVYRARLAGAAHPRSDLDGTLGLLWPTPEQLRAVVRGLSLTDARSLAIRDDALIPWERLPDDALLYVPADYGERYLLRVMAKYGQEALFGAPTA